MAENTKDFQNVKREKIPDTHFNFFSFIQIAKIGWTGVIAEVQAVI
jgi:hypothetical protein